jgi:hypothetical protein
MARNRFARFIAFALTTSHTTPLTSAHLRSPPLTSAQVRKLRSVLTEQGFEFDVIALRPEKYNELYASFRNLNRMLAWGHATVIEELARKKTPISPPSGPAQRPVSGASR